jgi:hypothetical protein
MKVYYSDVLHNSLLFISKHIERIQFGIRFCLHLSALKKIQKMLVPIYYKNL